MLIAAVQPWGVNAASASGAALAQSSGSQLELRSVVKRALSAFEAGQFAEALGGFEQALASALLDAQKASLHFNAAACLMGLNRPEQAEARFLLVIQLSTDQASAARMQAGWAALAVSAVDRAERHRRAVSPGDSQEREQWVELGQAIAEKRLAITEEQRASLLIVGYQQLAERAFPQARQAFVQLLALSPGRAERADALYGLAMVAFEHRQFASALQYIEQSLALHSASYEAHWLRATLAREMGQPDAAKRSWQKALKLGPPPALRRAIQRALERGDRRLPEGASASVSLAGGFDTNASQAGAAVRTGLSSTEDSVAAEPGSSIFQGQLELTLNQRLGEFGSLREQLLVSNWALSHSSVRDYSLNRAELSVRGGYYVLPWLETWTSLGVGHLRTGLAAATPFLSLLRLSGGGSATAWSGLETRFGSEYEIVRGLQDHSELTGYRLRAFASENFTGNLLSWELGVEGLLNTARRQLLVANSGLFPRCASSRIVLQAVCDTLMFSVPLSYRAASITSDLSYPLSTSLVLEVGLGYQYRHYSDSSQLLMGRAGTTVPDSETQRRDHYWDGNLNAQWLPEFLAPWSVWAKFRSLIVLSNLKPDLLDPEHRFDYENRNYTQHRVLGGIRLTIP